MAGSIDPKKVPSFTLASGEKIPAVGMGTFGSDKYGPDAVSAAVAGAIPYGYRAFDCAPVYGNEDRIGAVFEGAVKSGVVKREGPITSDEMDALNKAGKNCRLVKGQVFLWEGAGGWEGLWD
jgi:diketogulonate reductase-like aldo/keto reductase